MAKKNAASKKKAADPKKTSMLLGIDGSSPSGWRAWCDTEAKWIGPWRGSPDDANEDAQPHIDANHITEIKLKFG